MIERFGPGLASAAMVLLYFTAVYELLRLFMQAAR